MGPNESSLPMINTMKICYGTVFVIVFALGWKQRQWGRQRHLDMASLWVRLILLCSTLLIDKLAALHEVERDNRRSVYLVCTYM